MNTLTRAHTAPMERRMEELYAHLSTFDLDAVAELRALLASYATTCIASSASSTRFETYTRAIDAVMEVLTEQGVPMSIPEIRDEVLKGGFMPHDPRRGNVVANTIVYHLRSQSPRLRKNEDGQVELAQQSS